MRCCRALEGDRGESARLDVAQGGACPIGARKVVSLAETRLSVEPAIGYLAVVLAVVAFPQVNETSEDIGR